MTTLCRVSAIGLAAVAMAIPARARAYNAGNCIGVDDTTDALLTRNADPTGPYLANNQASDLTIECPIIKKNSGPQASGGDYVSYIDVAMQSSGGRVTCTMNIWRSDVQSLNSGNQVFTYSASGSATGTFRIAPTFGIDHFWTNYAADQTKTNWEYVDLECVLPPHTALTTYTVQEAGAAQGPKIYPPSACKADTTNNPGPWRYDQALVDWGDYTGGMFYFPAEGATRHAVRCPVDAGVSVEFAGLPASSENLLGCNIDTLPYTAITWPTTFTLGDPSFQVLPRAGQRSILIPNDGNTHQLVCGQKNGGVGDGSVISYRTVPPLPRGGASKWTASAPFTGGGAAGQSLDGNAGTRFSTGVPQASNGTQYLEIDMKASRPIRQVVLDSSGSPSDYPRGYKVYVSTTGTDWKTLAPVATGAGNGAVTAIRFPSVNGRWIRVVQTGTSSQWWSVHEFNVYQ